MCLLFHAIYHLLACNVSSAMVLGSWGLMHLWVGQHLEALGGNILRVFSAVLVVL